MSCETKTVEREKVTWILTLTKSGERGVDVGKYNFNRAGFSIAMLEFLAGAKRIDLEPVEVEIPDGVDGVVEFGHLLMPYKEFVKGFSWFIQQGGIYAEEHQVPLFAMFNFAAGVLEEKLLQALPEKNEAGLELAKKLKQELQQPGGIHGLKLKNLPALRQFSP